MNVDLAQCLLMWVYWLIWQRNIALSWSYIFVESLILPPSSLSLEVNCVCNCCFFFNPGVIWLRFYLLWWQILYFICVYFIPMFGTVFTNTVVVNLIGFSNHQTGHCIFIFDLFIIHPKHVNSVSEKFSPSCHSKKRHCKKGIHTNQAV